MCSVTTWQQMWGVGLENQFAEIHIGYTAQLLRCVGGDHVSHTKHSAWKLRQPLCCFIPSECEAVEMYFVHTIATWMFTECSCASLEQRIELIRSPPAMENKGQSIRDGRFDVPVE